MQHMNNDHVCVIFSPHNTESPIDSGLTVLFVGSRGFAVSIEIGFDTG